MLDIDGRHEYTLLHGNSRDVGSFKERRNVREIYVPTLPAGAAVGTLVWDQVTMPWYARREAVDVIFHTKFAIPLVSSRHTAMVLHGTERFLYPEFHPKGDILFHRTVFCQYLKRASIVLAVSERARLDVIKILNLHPDRVRTVRLAASPVFRVARDTGYLSGVRAKYRLPERFILHVGGLYPGKNVGRLIRALDQVRRTHDVQLVLAGFYRHGFKPDLELIRKLGLENVVHLIGYVPHEDLVGVYNLAALTAFPSFYESFPAIPLEANACGCPVVTSPTGGTPEAAGDAAVYVEPLDTDGLAQAIS
jgi:glycosyltransferase involved in cell wall biosynthesis